MKSPCIECNYEFADKNKPPCTICKKRDEYNVKVGHYPQGVSDKQDLDQREKEAKAEVAETKMGLDMADLKAGESTKRKRKQQRPPLVDLDVLRSMMDAGKPIKDIAEHFGVSGPSIRYHTKKLGYPPQIPIRQPKHSTNQKSPKSKTQKSEDHRHKGIHIRPTEYCSEIQIIANEELRSLPQQVLWILKERVEQWKKEHES